MIARLAAAALVGALVGLLLAAREALPGAPDAVLSERSAGTVARVEAAWSVVRHPRPP